MTMAATLCKITWLKVFKNGRSKICGRQPLKNLKGYGNCREGKLCRFFNAFVY